MAKACMVERNLKRAALIKKQEAKRKRLKAIIKDKDISFTDKMNAQKALSEMNRNGSKVRYRNRCAITGRSRGYYSKFGISRIVLRDLADSGNLPGVVKSSW